MPFLSVISFSIGIDFLFWMYLVCCSYCQSFSASSPPRFISSFFFFLDAFYFHCVAYILNFMPFYYCWCQYFYFKTTVYTQEIFWEYYMITSALHTLSIFPHCQIAGVWMTLGLIVVAYSLYKDGDTAITDWRVAIIEHIDIILQSNCLCKYCGCVSELCYLNKKRWTSCLCVVFKSFATCSEESDCFVFSDVTSNLFSKIAAKYI